MESTTPKNTDSKGAFGREAFRIPIEPFRFTSDTKRFKMMSSFEDIMETIHVSPSPGTLPAVYADNDDITNFIIGYKKVKSPVDLKQNISSK
nr:hypothetical protein HmN_000551200 [Hymenolepis microstoma]